MLENGMFIADRYEVVTQIGTGGMSDVYKAIDHTLGRNVAIKVLKAEFCEEMNFVTKFRTEAQSAARLEHPNIVNIYDVGSQDGFYYIIMEYVEGITLKSYIEKKGQLNYKETLSIAIQVGRGIQAAHAKNIIHRDIKPQNIIISTDGKVKVTDFGIARAVSEHTIHSDVMGSVHYASPEQARNGYVSNRSDIYSLGIVMYEMITGRVPFDGDSTVAVAIKHLQDEMVSPSEYAKDIPVSLEKIILKCTQKSADRRYDSMDSLLVDLRKSLLNPNEDFVTLVPYNQDKTRILTDEEVREIQEKTGGIDESADDGRDDDDGEEYEYEDPDDEFDGEDDDDESGRFLNSKMEKIINVLRIVVAIIIVLIVLYILGSFFGLIDFGFGKKDKAANDTQTEQQTDDIVMIDLTGKTLSEAEETLKELGLTVEQKDEQASDEYEAGQIIAQDVAKGETVKAGTTIYVTVSTGPEAEEVSVPDVVGDLAENAMAQLEDEGLVVKREFQYDSSVEAGKVISQDPSAGTKAKAGDTVTIYVSQGTESAKVPDVTGKTQQEAQTALGDAGLNLGNVSEDYSDTVAEGSVISQSVSSGQYVDKGTKVNLVVSKGAKTVSYYARNTVQAPSNVTVSYADITLYKGNMEEEIKSWDGVTSFPFEINVHGITGTTSGKVVIDWFFTDENGEEGSYRQTADVTFREE